MPPVTAQKKAGGMGVSGATAGIRRPPGVTGTAPQAKPAKPHSIRSCDTKLAQLILDEVIEGGSAVTWDDISGQEVNH